MSSTCGASALSAADVVAALAGPSVSAASEAQVAASVAAEARLRAAAASGAGAAQAVQNRDTFLDGIRNRLLLKYVGVDYEIFNTPDMIYRGGQVSALELAGVT